MEVKATLLDDDAFRLLAIPFGGPIPSPYSPTGVDLDGEWFDEATDIDPDRLKARPVDWHHGFDTHMKATTIGKAVDPVMEDDGWWVTVWLDHGQRRLDLIKELADRGAKLFGSSQSVGAEVVKASTGHIDTWPYVAQALSTAPQNTYSVMEPLKADASISRPYKALLPRQLHDLAADLRDTSDTGDPAAVRRRLDEFSDAAERTLDTMKTT